MTDKKRVIVVDDQDFFREGLIILLKKSKNIEVIAEAADGKEFLDISGKHNPDVVVMDINMPVMDGIETTKQAMAMNPNLKVLALSMFWDEDQFFKMIRAGAKGFILKSTVFGELEKAVLEVSENRNYFSEELRRQTIKGIKEQTQINLNFMKIVESLTKQEIEILKLIVAGLSKENIAKKLKLTIKAMDLERKTLLSKTSCKNSASLIMFAIKNNIVEGV